MERPSPPNASLVSNSPSASVYGLAAPSKSSYQMTAGSDSCGWGWDMTTLSMRCFRSIACHGQAGNQATEMDADDCDQSRFGHGHFSPRLWGTTIPSREPVYHGIRAHSTTVSGGATRRSF